MVAHSENSATKSNHQSFEPVPQGNFRPCVVFLMQDHATRLVYRLYDFTKSHRNHVRPLLLRVGERQRRGQTVRSSSRSRARAAPAGQLYESETDANLPTTLGAAVATGVGVRRRSESMCIDTEFQSTRPTRGATPYSHSFSPMNVFQSTRPTRGATGSAAMWILRRAVSIHAPHTERDAGNGDVLDDVEVSIHAPHTGRDGDFLGVDDLNVVSIHAPHTGRDPKPSARSRRHRSFNPRAPHGARRPARERRDERKRFNPRAPTRGATSGLRSPAHSS